MLNRRSLHCQLPTLRCHNVAAAGALGLSRWLSWAQTRRPLYLPGTSQPPQRFAGASSSGTAGPRQKAPHHPNQPGGDEAVRPSAASGCMHRRWRTHRWRSATTHAAAPRKPRDRQACHRAPAGHRKVRTAPQKPQDRQAYHRVLVGRRNVVRPAVCCGGDAAALLRASPPRSARHCHCGTWKAPDSLCSQLLFWCALDS